MPAASDHYSNNQ